MSSITNRRADPRLIVEKLRTLISHPGTEETIRAVARDKLDVLAPRRRRAERKDAPVPCFGRMVHAAYGAADGIAPVPGRGMRVDANRLDLLV